MKKILVLLLITAMLMTGCNVIDTPAEIPSETSDGVDFDMNEMNKKIDAMEVTDKRKEQIREMSDILIPGTWDIVGNKLVDIPVTNVDEFPDYYDIEVFKKYNIETDDFYLFFVKNTVTYNTIVYLKDKSTNKLNGVSAQFIFLLGCERAFFDNDGHFILLTRSARGYSEFNVFDFENNIELFDAYEPITAMNNNGNVYVSSENTIYDKYQNVVFTLPEHIDDSIIYFAVSNELDTISYITGSRDFVTYRKNNNGEFEEVLRVPNNNIYTEYKNLVLRGEYFYIGKSTEFENEYDRYIIGDTHYFTDFSNNYLFEATPFGTIRIDVLTGEIDLSDLKPQVVAKPSAFKDYKKYSGAIK